MTPFILNYARWRNVWILFGSAVILCSLLMFSLSDNAELQPLDLLFSYNHQEAYSYISAYNESERALYILLELTLDIVYPITYSLCLCLAIFLLYGKINLAKFSLIAIIFELVENACIVIALVNYPIEHPWIIGIASVFTSMKWISVSLSVLLVLFGFGRKLIKSGG